jgi:hypothetical protein
MMAAQKTFWPGIVLVGIVVLALPPLALSLFPPRPSADPMPTVRPLALAPVPDGATVPQRALFTTPDGNAVSPLEVQQPDLPQLVGIVGRLPQDGVALVRRGDGSLLSLRSGEQSEGWQLTALARDAVLFTRDGQTRRVELPVRPSSPEQALPQ